MSKQTFLPPRFRPTADVREFHTKFEQGYEGPVRPLRGHTIFRGEISELRFIYRNIVRHSKAIAVPSEARHKAVAMLEEVIEYMEAAEAGDLEGQLDALIDLAYFVFGTAYHQGFDIYEGWRRVHEANMKKALVRDIPGAVDKRGFGNRDILKPEGWKPPVLTDLVRDIDYD